MTIWQIAEYSLAISIVALLMLIMKRVFHDKLDARWHYFIWLVLAVRVIVPMNMDWIKAPVSLFQSIPIGYWINMWALRAQKAGIERIMERLGSVYLAGVLVLGVYYLAVSIILRIRIIRLPAADAGTVEYVAAVARKYHLKTCKKIKLTAKGTPYVSGLIKPTLVLPQKGQCPEEVILHELLHKKYGDVLVNYLLHLMRILQWCNPLIWYVTAVIQNDSEALCDQRVLETVRNHDSDHNGSMPNAQKEYGSLLLDMAEHRYFGKNTIGTSNMANSGHSMKIRIRRIVDFGKVPVGIGFAALCITIILSISSIAYYDSRKSIITEGIENEADLQYAFLRAQVYEAETAQEAAYLYLKAMKEMNPMYLMAVLPEEELPALEEWILDTYRAEGFYHDESGRIFGENWIYYKGMQPNPWFIQDGSKITGFTFYNMNVDERTGSAVAEVVIKTDEQETSYWWDLWELSFFYEDGWKVRRLGERGLTDSAEMAPALLKVSGEQNGWLVEAEARNEGSFNSEFTSFGWSYSTGNNAGILQMSQDADYPSQFESSIKWNYAFLSYQGEESLEGKKITAVIQLYDDKELRDNPELANPESPVQEKLSKQESAILSGNKGVLEKEQIEEPESSMFSSSEGVGYLTFDGAELMEGKRKMIHGSGGGYDSWKGDEILHFTAWIYCDGECVEVIQK